MMSMWIFLIAGTVLLVTAAVMAIAQNTSYFGRRLFGSSSNKKRKMRLEDTASLPCAGHNADFIDEYWNAALATGAANDVSFFDEMSQVAQVVHTEKEEPEIEVEIPVKVMGDAACELGVDYFDYLLSNGRTPRGSLSLTNESNIIIARNTLSNRLQSVTLSHGAVAQRIGDRTLCIFEPLENSVQSVEKAVEALRPLVEDKVIFFVLAETDGVNDDKLSHIGRMAKAFRVPESHIFIRQTGGGYVNYIEDIHDFVPDRIDVSQMPPEFFRKILHYAHSAFEEDDTECVMRCLEPLLGELYTRSLPTNGFPKVLTAQALNLVGMARRTTNDDEVAIRYFESSLALLKEAQDYEAIKSVEANLGITLALCENRDLNTLVRASNHLQKVTELNPSDREAWLYLADTFMQRYRLTQKVSFVHRAHTAYVRANELQYSESLRRCIDEIAVTHKVNRPMSIGQKINPPVVPQPKNGKESNAAIRIIMK